MTNSEKNTIRSVLLVGGPDAGKSNYLHRLWIALQLGNGCLKAQGLPALAEYLNTGVQALLCGNFVGRTPLGVLEQNSIPVTWTDDGQVHIGEVIIPDCSGEEWNKIHRTREWSLEWEQTLPSVQGCVLFIRAGSDKIMPALDWLRDAVLLQAADATGEASLKPDDPAESQSDAATETVELPTQVVLVDWLQCLSHAVRSVGMWKPLNVSIVIAAWDRLPRDQQNDTPEKYIDANFPMLFDFVKANTDRFSVKYLGTSVAGGDFDVQAGFKEQYLSGNPKEAGYVVQDVTGDAMKSLDHALPIAWALGMKAPFTISAEPQP
jgi:hypothetical protein